MLSAVLTEWLIILQLLSYISGTLTKDRLVKKWPASAVTDDFNKMTYLER